mgnify:CR=1 FL=1|tara:strand:+ start:7352 stop:7555 length:204 start_codon:yes stop_codon:yes gene_type:complete
MPLSNDQFVQRLSEVADPTLLCELLNISSEDILERFDDLLEERMCYLREIFDIDVEEVLGLEEEYEE